MANDPTRNPEDPKAPEPEEENNWTPEATERFLRLGEALAKGRLDEQWEIEFPEGKAKE